MLISDFKSGYYEPQGGYEAFVPNLINHDWILSDGELEIALAEANRRIGALDALADLVPGIERFLDLYIAKEAATSSKIEGTRTNVEELFLPKAEIKPEQRDDWREVKNYVEATNFALNSLSELPLSSRLMRRIHEILMQGVRGKHKQPGAFRRSQNWIGGATIQQARFVPPPWNAVPDLISDIEKFIHNRQVKCAELIRIGICHYQFETIHPFLDGNGRTGRLLIMLQLIDIGYLSHPVLYLSDYIERNRSEYYDRLNRVRTENDLRGWLLYFLRGICEVSEEASKTLRAIIALRDRVYDQLPSLGRRYEAGRKIMDRCFKNPVISVNEASEVLGVQFAAANRLIDELASMELLQEITGQQRNRLFSFRPYLWPFQ